MRLKLVQLGERIRVSADNPISRSYYDDGTQRATHT